MRFLRRGNKKKEEKILPASPTITTSFSSPRPPHLKLNNETMVVKNNKKTNNGDSKIQSNNGYTSRSSIESSFIKKLHASETNTKDDSIRHHNNPSSTISSSGSPTALIGSSDFSPADAAPITPTSITSLSSNVNSVQEVDVSHLNVWKKIETNIIPPAATITDSTKAIISTAPFGCNHPVNSVPDQKENSRTFTNLSSTDSTSNPMITIQTKSTLFKHKTASIFDSDASESEEDNDDDNDNDTVFFLSNNKLSKTNIPFNHIKQRKEQRSKGPVAKTSTAANASNSNLSGGNSGVPPQAILMSRMKERHRKEYRKSCQSMDKRQHNPMYLQRMTPTMPPMYKMDGTISPGTSEMPMSEPSISFALVSHLSAALPTTQTIGVNKQQRQRETMYRSRLQRPLSMPCALDIVSRGSIDASITPWCPTASVTSSKRDSTMKKSNRSARASSWSTLESHQKQRSQQKNIFSNGPASIQLVGTPSTMSPPSSPTPGYYQQQQNANVLPCLIPMTPPPDDINSPIVSPTKLTQSMLDIEDVPRKEASEFERMHENRSSYSLPDLSQFATTTQQQRSQKKYSRFGEKPLRSLNGLNKEALKPKIKKNNNEVTTFTTIKHHETLGLEERNGITSCMVFSSANGMELGHKQLLPLGETLPTVLVAKESGLSQYYLVLSQDEHSAFPSFQHRYNDHHQCCHSHKKDHHHQHQCDSCPMQKKSCCHNNNQQHQHHRRHNFPLFNGPLTKSTRRQNKCNRSGSSGKLCNHYQQQKKEQRVSLSHQRHHSTWVIQKEKQQNCHQ